MLRDLRFADYFLFTQYSLGTFDNCPLKFKKRYLEGLKWDSYPDEKIKKRLETGNDFHLLAYRYFMRTDTGIEQATEFDGELMLWMDRLKANFEFVPFVSYLPEYKLRMISDHLKLEANFDLLMIKEDSIEIWDWKTHGTNIQGKAASMEKKLRESLQTVVYMFVLKEQAALIMGRDLECEKISMHYWQPDPPSVIAEIGYSEEQHQLYKRILESKIKHVLTYDYSNFDKTLYSKHCKYCEFNWFCNNERVDFNVMLEEDEGLLEELSWEDVEERY